MRDGARAGGAASSGASARTSSRPACRRSSIDLMERGFVSALATNGAGIIHDFELALSRQRRRRTSTRRSAPAASAWRRKPATLLNAAINDGVRARSRASGRRWPSTCAATAPPHAASERAGRGRAARDAGDGARRDRHRHHPHAPGRLGRGARRRQPARLPLLRVERRAARRRRLPELRLGGRAARGVPEGGRARAQPAAPCSTDSRP